ncbi:hypothetical protein HanHA300_Chr05g0183131 [Helianthus annuus]|nr:hypothetical protein HanHA300_Chr05g0183131 [Helianthus annuus]KAJ0747857.1 hypothetical protein HanOQP8_Chr05g0194361 [Helianthus annuus]
MEFQLIIWLPAVATYLDPEDLIRVDALLIEEVDLIRSMGLCSVLLLSMVTWMTLLIFNFVVICGARVTWTSAF